MGLVNGQITAPVSLQADVYAALGLQKTGTYYDIGYICSNQHGQTNRYSYRKPIEENTPAEVQFTNQKYIDSLTPVTYRGGQTPPTSALYGYNAPGSWYRLTDWVGYRHTEYPVRASLASLPATADFEHTERISVSYADSGQLVKTALLSMLLSGNPSASVAWYNRILLLIKVGTAWRAFLLKRYVMDYGYVNFDLMDQTLYTLLRGNGADTFQAVALLVGIPYGHGGERDGIREVTQDGLTYTLLPQSPACSPIRQFTLRKPKRRCFMTLHIEDSGNSREYWVPDGTLIQASLTYDNEDIFVLSSHAFDQGDDYTDEDSRVNEGTHYVQGEVQLPDVRFTANGQWVKPEVQSNASRTEYDAALQTTFLYWDRQVAGDAFTMDVGFTYADPNYRPET